MDEEINRLTSIKAIGWTTLIIFGTMTLWIIFQIIGTLLFDNSVNNFTAGQEEFNDAATEMKDSASQMRLILLTIGGLTLVTTVGAIGVLKTKQWGLILFQSSTIVVIVALLSGLAYYVYNAMTQMDKWYDHTLSMGMSGNFVAAQNYQTIGYGTFLLLFSWILTRANIFLSKRDNRKEFR